MTALSDLGSLLGHRAQPENLSYGTAGFRSRAENLYEAVLRCGALAAARSHLLSQATAVMVTASHNPAEDNGLKLIEPDGSMLASEWELLASRFVNDKHSPEHILNDAVPIHDLARAAKSVVLLGRDTRQSSPALSDLVSQGVHAVGGKVIDLNVVTTPQLHFAVRAHNAGEPCSVGDYYAVLRSSFRILMGNAKRSLPSVVVDCANGVGATALEAIADLLPGSIVVNCPGDGNLNEDCGADFVQKKRRVPRVYTTGKAASTDQLWASLDGDADRLVMFETDLLGITLSDGDRFATLVASFVSRNLVKSALTGLAIGVAQTAYSNGASTEFLRTLPGLEIIFAKTGVKHLEKAIKDFDIGIYWEPNGHGTVLFSEKAVRRLHERESEFEADESQKEKSASASMLIALSKLANQAIGDGVANLLLVLGILACTDMCFADWLQMYDEWCSSNKTIRVANKNVILTEDCDRLVKEPKSLRDAITNASSGRGCRAFVRPSGTEDLVRVYAESPVGEDGKAEEIALQVSRAVYDFCGGVGERP